MTYPTIYLDNNATTHIDPVVAARINELNLTRMANPASQHRSGRQALEHLEDAKSDLLQLLGVSNGAMETAQVILTSGGTEANNLAVLGLRRHQAGTVIVGGTEHPSVLEAAKLGRYPGQSYRVLPVDSGGLCDLDQLETWLKEIYGSGSGQGVSLVSVMMGNNETGVIQDLKSICSICRRYDVPVHSDLVQAVGKLPVNVTDLGLSALTLTAHKIHGPVGIGALVLLDGLQLDPMLVGGGQQLGVRPGTEPVVPAVALALALRRTCEARENAAYDAVSSLREQFERSLGRISGTEVIAAASPRLPHTSNIAFHDLDRQALHMALDLAGIACSTGSACASGSSRPSSVLSAMGLPENTITSSLRFSFSRFNSVEDMESASQIVTQVVEKMRSKT